MYEKIDDDPSKETEEEVRNLVNNLKNNGHMKTETAEYIKSKLSNNRPGPYYEQPKDHKCIEETHDMSSGFPGRGIVSCSKSSTESLQDFVDFK